MAGSRRIGALVCILSLLAFGTITAGEETEIQLTPFLGLHSGKTSYEFNIKQLGPDTRQNQQVYTVRSRLEFPVDATLVGLSFRIHPKADTQKWSLKANIATNLTNPNGTMTDSDWEAITNYFPITLFSYTESSVEMSMIKSELDFSRHVWKVGSVGISLLAGLKYQWIDQDIIGYNGWYLPFDSTTFRFLDTRVEQSGTGKVLTYRLTTYNPYGGIKLNVDPSPVLQTEAEVGLGPVFYSDRDDHLLRHKLSTATGNGLGVTAAMSAVYQLSQGKKSSYVIGLMGDMQYASMTGSQTQTWYADEVVVGPTPTDSTVIATKGTTISGLPHDVDYTLWTFGIMVGLRF